MKAILNKLWGNNKRSTDVKQTLREVKLNKITEISSSLDVFRDKMNESEQLSDEAHSYYKSSFETLRDAWGELDNTKSELQNLEDTLDEMGVPNPVEFEDLVDKLYTIENEMNAMFKNFETLGFYT